MYYVTWSEGFRPGLLNRPVGRTSPDGSYTVPPSIDSDEITNVEFGWKTILRDGRLRFNGSAFMVDVEGLQTTVFDPSIVNLFFSDNAADGEIKGVEGDFTYITNVEGLSVSGAFSVLETELTKRLVPTNDVVVGSDLAFAPRFQGNLRIKQEWEVGNGLMAHVIGQVTISDSSYSDVMEVNKAKQNSYSMLDVRGGVSADDWKAELYIDNLTDERGEISNTFVFDRQRVSYVRPMTIGIRYKQNF